MIFFFGLSLIYILFFIWCSYQWKRIIIPNPTEVLPMKFTVLIPVRNEASTLPLLLRDLEKQSIDLASFEVIVIDDNSEDNTMTLVRELLPSLVIDCQLLELGAKGLEGKKNAITLGVANAKHEIIIATDGDCRMGIHWLAAYSRAFSNQKTQMVSGPVCMNANTFFEQLQVLEFSALIGIGAATLSSGNPTMCNGANMGYRKAVFEEVNGYAGNEGIASGDDEFLLQKVFKNHPEGISFLKDAEALVTTKAKGNLKEFLNQRIRWSSKWKHHKSVFIWIGAMIVFFNYVFVYGALAWSAYDIIWLPSVLCVIILRWLAMSRFLNKTATFSGIRYSHFMTFFLEIIYPVFVLFLGIASIFGKYSWKGRRY
ncbi:MAG: cellulose synthase/poly-beta-1,6-N-acetylglucosamine synthase-like glycosyltransferase [Marinoscillum sp.]|jgi:cellulose synthase/poly-beta-1,6-N-acetylglucosamine synthase-like glycosyltransferase